MQIIELAQTIGLTPKKVSSNREEHHSSCPACGGDDRFVLWAADDRFWCRRCHLRGDSIEFCRLFMGMGFVEASNRVGRINSISSVTKQVIEPIRPPVKSWIEKAEEFVESSHRRLIADPADVAKITKTRGLTIDSIRRFRIGLNPIESFPRRSDWGLPEENGHQKLCLPAGYVLPGFYDQRVRGLKIRRSNWRETDKLPKYHQVASGGPAMMGFFGFRTNRVAVLVESEFDAMLLVQEIGEFCTCIALGGAGKKPDPITTEWLRNRRLILYALDSDEAGRERYGWWRQTFPQLRAWPANSQKSPADSFLLDGINLSDWFKEGIQYCNGKIWKI